MARVRSTAWVTHDGDETEVMRLSGLDVTEGTNDEGTPAFEAEQVDIE
jgi:hypothetical protein